MCRSPERFECAAPPGDEGAGSGQLLNEGLLVGGSGKEEAGEGERDPEAVPE